MEFEEYENLYDDEVWLDATRGVSGIATATETDDEIKLTDEEKAEAEAWLNEPVAPEKIEREDDGFDI